MTRPELNVDQNAGFCEGTAADRFEGDAFSAMSARTCSGTEDSALPAGAALAAVGAMHCLAMNPPRAFPKAPVGT